MSTTRLLIVDDVDGIRFAFNRYFTKRGYEVEVAGSAEDAIDKIETEPAFDAVLTDLKMPGAGGIGLMRHISKRGYLCSVLLMTAYSAVEDAIEAMRLGACDYICKPTSPEEVEARIVRALKRREATTGKSTRTAVPTAPDRSPAPKPADWFISGNHSSVSELRRLIDRYADADATVLVTGESGTGKELVAKELHRRSPRHRGPFIAVNCGALPGHLLESELFGHMKGAFTDAVQTRPGRFALADGGTIFLDEVGEMPMELQVKLLRVLQERVFTPVGGTEPVSADFRVVAATNRDLMGAVEDGEFREDLFYRLNVLRLTTPPLRDRNSDIPSLVEDFVVDYNSDKRCHVAGISSDAMSTLRRYPWPGNVRELQNIMQRTVILKNSGTVETDDLPLKVRQGAAPRLPDGEFEIPEGGIDFNRAIDDFERQLIVGALRKTGGNRNQAAQLIGLKRTTLVEKLKRKKLDGWKVEGRV